jgi:antitoxin Phd
VKGVVIVQKQFSIAEAKNKLPSIIHFVEKEPYVELTRRGKPVAVLLSIQEYERLSRKFSGFWSAVTAFRQNIQDKGIRISDKDFEGLRDSSLGREVKLRK